MCAGGVGLPKFVCGPLAYRSATRLPISWGDEPLGQFSNSLGRFFLELAACDCAAQVWVEAPTMARHITTNIRRGVRRFMTYVLTTRFYWRNAAQPQG